jgi:hypothetical protein
MARHCSYRSTQAKENADDLLAQKKDLDAEAAALKEKEIAAEAELRKKANRIGNLVHDSVPVSDDEVRSFFLCLRITLLFFFSHLGVFERQTTAKKSSGILTDP